MGKSLVALDDGASLVTIEPRHENIAENNVGMCVVDAGEGIKSVFCQQHFVSALFQKNFCATSNGIAVVDYKYFQSHAPS